MVIPHPEKRKFGSCAFQPGRIRSLCGRGYAPNSLIDVSARAVDVVHVKPTQRDTVVLDAEDRHPLVGRRAQPGFHAFMNSQVSMYSWVRITLPSRTSQTMAACTSRLRPVLLTVPW
jgi:hypothetical protein